MRLFTTLFLMIICLVVCNPTNGNGEQKPATNLDENQGDAPVDFHLVALPEEYAGLTNPIVADVESIQRGRNAFLTYCAVCHGETGLGDGPGADGLDPPIVAIAQTQHLLSDDFLYFRIRDGGIIAPFNSAMPAWENILDKRTIWDLINYIRTMEG